MEPQAQHEDLLAALLSVAEGLGIQIRHVAMGGSGGGLATLRGQRILFVDSDADGDVQLDRTAGGLSQLAGELESVYLKPALRALLERD